MSQTKESAVKDSISSDYNYEMPKEPFIEDLTFNKKIRRNKKIFRSAINLPITKLKLNKNFNNSSDQKVKQDDFNNCKNNKILNVSKNNKIKFKTVLTDNTLRNLLEQHLKCADVENKKTDCNNNYLNSCEELLQDIKKPALNKLSLIAEQKIEDFKQKNTEFIQIKERQKQKTWYKAKKFLGQIVDHNFFILFFLLTTTYVTFIGYIQSGWLTIEHDEVIYILQIFFCFLHGSEFILNCLSVENYVFSYFFWFDVFNTVFDIVMIFDPITNLAIAEED